MKVSTALVLLALPMAAAKMRGLTTEDDFRRQLKGDDMDDGMDMDDGDMGGMGGDDGCPDPDNAPEILCRSNADCIGSPFCSNPDDCCCVAYTYSYCGSPSSCNQFLQCLPDNSPDVVPAPFTAAAVSTSFSLLSTVSQCLADALDGDASGDMPAGDSEDTGSKGSKKAGKRGNKSTKRLGNKMSGKRSKKLVMPSGDDSGDSPGSPDEPMASSDE